MIEVVGLETFYSFIGASSDSFTSIADGFGFREPSFSERLMRLSRDGDTLIYQVNHSAPPESYGSIYRRDMTSPSSESREIANDYLWNYYVSDDGTSVYYVNRNNEIWHVRDAGDPVKIADGVLWISYDVVAIYDHRLFFLQENDEGVRTLHYSAYGSASAKVADADNVTSFWSTPNNVFYSTNDAVYRSSGDERFSLFHEGAQRIGGSPESSIYNISPPVIRQPEPIPPVDPDSYTMPDLRNMHQFAAANHLRSLDLNLDIIITTVPSDVEQNHVVNTHPVAGGFLTRNDSVLLIISGGPEEDIGARGVAITYAGRVMSDVTIRIDESVTLRIRVEPLGFDTDDIRWVSSNQDVFEVISVSEDKTTATIIGRGAGTATLSVIVGDVSADCVVRVRAR